MKRFKRNHQLIDCDMIYGGQLFSSGTINHWIQLNGDQLPTQETTPAE